MMVSKRGKKRKKMNEVRGLPVTPLLGLVCKIFGDHIESSECIVFLRHNVGSARSKRATRFGVRWLRQNRERLKNKR